ncbi:hypothetical protein C8Q74DRAFT_1365943 [Fomes fomentarius]|nr:hypothetical protein C8Q74DRAFT_1365943 [Fomes fomentarius]
MHPEVDDVAALVSYDRTAVLNKYCTCSILALLFFEYAITFRKEVELFWARRFSGVCVLFLVLRYLVLAVLLVCMLALMQTLTKPVQSCNVLMKAIPAMIFLLYLPWAVFSGMRVFALSRHRLFSLLVFMLSVSPLGINYMQYLYDLQGTYMPNIGCVETVNASPDLETKSKYVILRFISRTCLTLSDMLVILVTWYKLYRLQQGCLATKNWSIAGVLLRDGSVYFVALLLLNVLHVTFLLLPPSVSQGYGSVTLFSEPITNILVVRFMIDLQEANQRTLKVPSDHPLHLVANSDSMETPSFVDAMATFSSLVPDDTVPVHLNA